MAFFELLLGIGIIGTSISFALTMFLDRKDGSIEEQIAGGTTILFLVIAIAGMLGVLL